MMKSVFRSVVREFDEEVVNSREHLAVVGAYIIDDEFYLYIDDELYLALPRRTDETKT